MLHVSRRPDSGSDTTPYGDMPATAPGPANRPCGQEHAHDASTDVSAALGSDSKGKAGFGRTTARHLLPGMD